MLDPHYHRGKCFTYSIQLLKTISACKRSCKYVGEYSDARKARIST
jgi:hypothetical protein